MNIYFLLLAMNVFGIIECFQNVKTILFMVNQYLAKKKMMQAKQNINKQISECIFTFKLMKSVSNFVISLLKQDSVDCLTPNKYSSENQAYIERT